MEPTHNRHSSAFAKVESIISQVKDAERKADALIEKAKKDAEDLLAAAKVESAALARHEEEALAKEEEKKLNDVREKLIAGKEEELAEIAKEISELKSRAKKNQEKAVSHIIKVFEDRISYE